MTANDPFSHLIHRDDGDVVPESLSYLRQPNTWGWSCNHGISQEEVERSMDPLRRWAREEFGPDPDAHPERVIVWGLVALAFWVVGISLLWWAIRSGWVLR